ncbi:hypothetical protein GQR58_024081 [Nymphon striatum]|nr:hypothetical protein GQR58_024081 [Nymphon striatum]
MICHVVSIVSGSKALSMIHGQWTEKQTKTNIISMFMRKSVLVIVATFNRFYYKSSRWILYFAQAIVLFASYFMLIETSEHSTMKSFYWMTTHVISYSTVIISLSSFCIIIESLRTTLYLGCTVDLNFNVIYMAVNSPSMKLNSIQTQYCLYAFAVIILGPSTLILGMCYFLEKSGTITFLSFTAKA